MEGNIRILWACGYEQFVDTQKDFLNALKKEGFDVTLEEKYHKQGIISELKNNKYDYLITNEYIEHNAFETKMLEEIIDRCPDISIIFVVSGEHEGDAYAQKLINIGICNVIYAKDFNFEKLYNVWKNPMRRVETKLYLRLKSDIDVNSSVDQQAIANIIYHLKQEEGKENRNTLFEHISAQYNNDEIFMILSYLPGELLQELEGNSLVSAYIQSNTNNRIDTYKTDSGDRAGKTITKTEVLVEERVETQYVPISFNRFVIAGLGSTEFFCEMALAIAQATKYRVLFVNLKFDSSADMYLKISCSNIESLSREKCHEIGLPAVLDAMSKGKLDDISFERACIAKEGINNLHVLTEPLTHENFETYKSLDIQALIEAAYRKYDVVIIPVSSSLNDTYAIPVLTQSHYNIIAIPACIDSIREYQSLLLYLKEKNDIPLEKYKFVAFEYKKGIHLPLEYFKHCTSKDGFLGAISYSVAREKFRSKENVFYAKWAYRKDFKNFYDVLLKFNIVLSEGFNMKVKGRFSRFFKSLKNVPTKIRIFRTKRKHITYKSNLGE